MQQLSVAETYEYWSRLPLPRQEPSAPPVEAEWQGALPAFRGRSWGGLGDACGSPLQQYISANNVHIYCAATESSSRIQPLPSAEDGSVHPPDFHPNLNFQSCSFAAEGPDSGCNFVSRRYKFKRCTDSPLNLVIYSQCPSKTKTVAHVATLHMSAKRARHVIFLLDHSVLKDNPCSDWPPVIRLRKIQSMLHNLGTNYEFHKKEVSIKGSYFYLLVLKRRDSEISPRTRKAWSDLFLWTHENTCSSNSSSTSGESNGSQIIPNLFGIGFAALGVIA